jgi:hypothetical protein
MPPRLDRKRDTAAIWEGDTPHAAGCDGVVLSETRLWAPGADSGLPCFGREITCRPFTYAVRAVHRGLGGVERSVVWCVGL